jgi:UDP-GlcNAc:undecaprenyl-phosphate GlcNAc-1-phosphate transferase
MGGGRMNATPFAAGVMALVALFATLTATEIVRLFAHLLSAVDRPGGRRVHGRPTARLGGLGIFWGFSVALLVGVYGFGARFRGEALGVIGMVTGAGLLLIVGMVDDVRNLRPALKLGFQIGAGALLHVSGWGVTSVGVPGIGSFETGWWSLACTVGWVVLVTNALNLLDGLDGLACGVALVAALALCAWMAPESRPLLLMSAALAGALAGFLWFNVNPAQIFMGDAGSLVVGFVLSALTLRSGQVADPDAFPIVPMCLVAVPLLDTLDTIRRRTTEALRVHVRLRVVDRAERSPRRLIGGVVGRLLAADSMHIHHRLVRRGWSIRRAVAVLWLAAAIGAAVGLTIAVAPVFGGILAIGALASAGLMSRMVRTPSRPMPLPAPALGIETPPATEEERRLAA